MGLIPINIMKIKEKPCELRLILSTKSTTHVLTKRNDHPEIIASSQEAATFTTLKKLRNARRAGFDYRRLSYYWT